MRQTGPLFEIGSLVLIAFAVAFGGRAMLGGLHAFSAAAVLILGAGIVSLSISLRRLGRAANHLELSRRVAYLTGLLLAIWVAVAPARWNIGATIAMIEVAIAFDILARLTTRAPKGEGDQA